MAEDTIPTQPTGRDTSIEPDRVAFEAAQREPDAGVDQRPIQLAVRELGLGILALIIWFALFTGGILVPTQPYRDAIINPTGLASVFASWLMVCSFWTITNIGILAIVASLLGAVGRRTRFTTRTDPMQFAISASHPNGIATYYLSAAMRGFGVYSLVLGGLLVLATESLVSPTQDSYMRLAPTVSIISFYAGYDPGIFAGLLDRVKSFLQAGNPEGANPGSANPGQR